MSHMIVLFVVPYSEHKRGFGRKLALVQAFMCKCVYAQLDVLYVHACLVLALCLSVRLVKQQ